MNRKAVWEADKSDPKLCKLELWHVNEWVLRKEKSHSGRVSGSSTEQQGEWKRGRF